MITPTCSSVRLDLNYNRNKHLCHCITNGAKVHSFTGSACCLLTGRLAEASEEHNHKFICFSRFLMSLALPLSNWLPTPLVIIFINLLGNF